MTGAAPPAPIDWKAAGGQAWADMLEVLERTNRPIGEAVVERARITSGERVLDVGCGGGATTLDLGRRVGAGGRAVGVDISAKLLDLAREAASAAGLANVAFVEGDAQTYPFEPGGFDAVTSRFGVMFFSDPDAAFANLRRALTPDGRLAFACWRSPADNPLSTIAVKAAAPFLPPMPAPVPNAPGRFGFADADHVRGVLERSGWRGVDIAPLDTPTPVTFEELMALSLQLGVLGPILAEQPDEIRTEVHQAVEAALKAQVVDGLVPMVAACWLVSARA